MKYIFLSLILFYGCHSKTIEGAYMTKRRFMADMLLTSLKLYSDSTFKYEPPFGGYEAGRWYRFQKNKIILEPKVPKARLILQTAQRIGHEADITVKIRGITCYPHYDVWLVVNYQEKISIRDSIAVFKHLKKEDVLHLEMIGTSPQYKEQKHYRKGSSMIRSDTFQVGMDFKNYYEIAVENFQYIYIYAENPRPDTLVVHPFFLRSTIRSNAKYFPVR